MRIQIVTYVADADGSDLRQCAPVWAHEVRRSVAMDILKTCSAPVMTTLGLKPETFESMKERVLAELEPLVEYVVLAEFVEQAGGNLQVVQPLVGEWRAMRRTTPAMALLEEVCLKVLNTATA
jgi:hypothetical protein